MSEDDAVMEPSEAARRAEIRRIGTERFDDVSATLAVAYRRDPLVSWVLSVGDGADDDAARSRFWRGLLAGLPPGSEVHTTYDVDGVAVWRPLASDGDDHAGPDGETSRQERGYELVAFGVRPGSRHGGVGRRLVEPMVARADRLGLVLLAHAASPDAGTVEAAAVAGSTGWVAVRGWRPDPDGPPVVTWRREPAS